MVSKSHLSCGAVYFHRSFSAPGTVDVDGEGVQQVEHKVTFRVRKLTQSRLCSQEIETTGEHPVHSFLDLSDLKEL